MSKRTDAIRSMFSVGEPLSADNGVAEQQPRRVRAGSVRSLEDTFSEVERENEALRSKVAEGGGAVELDPECVDASPLADRFDEQDEASFEALKASIAERGQMIPALVRPHPDVPGRYQSAYGHRRIRAARALGIKVKAHVRNLSDEDLAIAQGVENSAREDLSFIERAMFAARLEAAGFARSVVQSALAIDRAEASKLVSVSKAIPSELVRAIGRAPKVGRSRWQALAERLKDDAAVERVRAVTLSETFARRPSDERFSAAYAATSAGDADPPRERAGSVKDEKGRECAGRIRGPPRRQASGSLRGLDRGG